MGDRGQGTAFDLESLVSLQKKLVLTFEKESEEARS
jgi:hypothetical protein